MFGFERVGLLPRCQPTIFDIIPFAFKQMLYLHTIGAKVLGHDHAIDDGGSIGGMGVCHALPYNLRIMVRSQA
jgi:hypothetical protein